MYTASITSLFVFTYIAPVSIIIVNLHYAAIFRGGVYWDDVEEIPGDILKAVGFQGVVRFRGNTVI